jgi:hypothetical protein
LRIVLVSASLAALLPTAVAAHSRTAPVVPESRAVRACRRAIEREAFGFAAQCEWREIKCVRALSECDTPATAASSCPGVSAACRTLMSDVSALALRLKSRLGSSCRGIPLDRMGRDLGYGAAVANCPTTSVDDFSTCFANSLRKASAAFLDGIEPAACQLATAAGVASMLPPEMCAAGGTDPGCPEPPTCPTCPTCPPPPPTGPLYCGGADGLACPDGFVCNRTDPLCSDANGGGECVPMPASCSAGGSPVCGCDGQTYASDCDRVKAGAVLSHAGGCDPEPAVSCGIGQPPCGVGFFCEFPRGDCGEGGSGTCRPMRAEPCNMCTAFMVGPVCGCDFTSYADDCARQAAGVSKAFDGSCF